MDRIVVLRDDNIVIRFPNGGLMSGVAVGSRGRFAGRVALVTGGSRGIGYGIAHRLVKEGASVVISSLHEDEGAQAARTLDGIAGRKVARHVRANVAIREEVEALVKSCSSTYGRLDIIVANAGVDRGAPFLEMDDSDWDDVLDVDLRGSFLTMQVGARQLVAEGHAGRIVAMASTNAFWVESNLTSYNVAKAGVVAMVRTASIELAQYGITVNAVGPGLIATRMTAPTIDNPAESAWYLAQIPMRRFGVPADVAGAVAYLASDDAAWVTGHHLVVDGGQTTGIDLPLTAISPRPGAS